MRLSINTIGKGLWQPLEHASRRQKRPVHPLRTMPAKLRGAQSVMNERNFKRTLLMLKSGVKKWGRV